jgi:hypothetical protein
LLGGLLAGIGIAILLITYGWLFVGEWTPAIVVAVLLIGGPLVALLRRRRPPTETPLTENACVHAACISTPVEMPPVEHPGEPPAKHRRRLTTRLTGEGGLHDSSLLGGVSRR